MLLPATKSTGFVNVENEGTAAIETLVGEAVDVYEVRLVAAWTRLGIVDEGMASRAVGLAE